jgi:hypothetical protein
VQAAAIPSVSPRAAYAQGGTNTLQHVFRDHFASFTSEYWQIQPTGDAHGSQMTVTASSITISPDIRTRRPEIDLSISRYSRGRLDDERPKYLRTEQLQADAGEEHDPEGKNERQLWPEVPTEESRKFSFSGSNSRIYID